MKKKVLTRLIVFTCIIGAIALFLFPEPESNFLAYLGTIILFTIIIIILSKIKLKKKN